MFTARLTTIPLFGYTEMAAASARPRTVIIGETLEIARRIWHSAGARRGLECLLAFYNAAPPSGSSEQAWQKDLCIAMAKNRRSCQITLSSRPVCPRDHI